MIADNWLLMAEVSLGGRWEVRLSGPERRLGGMLDHDLVFVVALFNGELQARGLVALEPLVYHWARHYSLFDVFPLIAFCSHKSAVLAGHGTVSILECGHFKRAVGLDTTAGIEFQVVFGERRFEKDYSPATQRRSVLKYNFTLDRKRRRVFRSAARPTEHQCQQR